MNTAYQEVEKLLAQIRAVTNNPVIQRSSDQIEVLCRAQFSPTEQFLPGIHFTPHERRIVSLLWARIGNSVGRDALLDAATYDSRDTPDPKLLDVHLCRIRRKLEQAGAPYHILTESRIGFRMMKGSISEAKDKGKKYCLAS